MTLATEDCEIEAGSQQVVMLQGVSAAATETLIALARDGNNAKRQKRAFFWLARSKDPKADEFIGRLLR